MIVADDNLTGAICICRHTGCDEVVYVVTTSKPAQALGTEASKATAYVFDSHSAQQLVTKELRINW